MRKTLIFKEDEGVLKRINIAYESMSRQHKTIADYIFEHLDKVAYMTVNQLAEHTDTSVATVLRLTDLLAYDSYPSFRQALKNQTKIRLTTLQRIHMPGFEDYSFKGVKDILKSDIKNIETTANELDEQTFESVIDHLITAKKIYLIGSRTTSILTEYLSYYLNLLLEGKVKLIQESVREPFEQLMHVTKDDVVMVLSFPRYSNRTIQYLAYSQKKEAKVIGITDMKSSPIFPYCEHILYAKSNIISFVDTLVAPLSLINAIIVGVGLKNEENTKKVFQKLEELWNESLTYDQFDN